MKKFLFLCFLLMAIVAPAAAQTIELVIDGKTISSDVAPYISNDRTMVPVRVISENLGAQVNWDAKTQKVTMTKSGVSIELTINSRTAIVNNQRKTLDAPAQIKQSRTMVPLRFISEAFNSAVTFDSATFRVKINTPVVNPPVGKTRSLTDLTWSTSGNDLVVNVALSGVELGTEKSFALQNPDRLVLDLTNTDYALSGGGLSKEFAVANNLLTRIRTSQFSKDEHITRLVFDLSKASTPKISRTASGVTIRFVNAIQTPPPPTNAATASLIDMDWQMEGSDFLVYIKSTNPEKIKETVSIVENPDRLILDLNNTTYGIRDENGNPITSKDFKLYNQMVFKARTSEFNKAQNISRIVLDLYQKPNYTITHTATGLTIRFKNVPTPPTSGPFKIFLDPGHGGYDPGAIGGGGTQEKAVVLAIAKKAQDLLEGLKDSSNKPLFQIQMLREDDTFIDLEGRVDQTLRFNPNLFVSIHANSAGTNRSANGTETYYRYEKYRDLAQKVQNGLIEQGQRYNRGVKQANFWVLAPYDVPSILVEAAFISNSVEENLLTTSEFQDKMAQGIVAGIKSYLGVK